MNNEINHIGWVVQDPVQKSLPNKAITIAEFAGSERLLEKKGKQTMSILSLCKTSKNRFTRWNTSQKAEKYRHGRVATENSTRKHSSRVLRYFVVLNGFHLCGSKLDVNEVACENAIVVEGKV